ncbi:MAG: hypothetical protein NXI23_17080 [Bacteroidetes bacterium]|jgi:hypothetical protein|nr:hypothetical protein [Bacteroidota bacterium]MDF1865180.1 hypothetical protein [Saprospiraceae bacterium]
MKKRSIFNLLLVLLIFVLVYVLISSIQEPIAFKAEKEKREDAVIAKLMQIREAQEAFRGVTGGFAGDFDTLQLVLERDSFVIVSIIGDPDDANFTGEITYDTTKIPAIDSVRALGLQLDSLRYVPYGKGEMFEIASDTLTYQKTMVNVVEVGTIYKVFMGEYASNRFKKYDDRYNPGKAMKFGDLNKPTVAGSWDN